MNISSFISCTSHLPRLLPLVLLKDRPHLIQCHKCPPESCPKTKFLSGIFYIERVNRILYINLVTPKHQTMVFKWPRKFVCRSATDTTGPFLPPPFRHRIIKYIRITYLIDIRSP